MDKITLFKEARENLLWDPVRYNQDQKAVEDAVNGLIDAAENTYSKTETDIKYATNEGLQQVIAGQVNIVDPSTGKKYAWGFQDGQFGLLEVV